MHDDFQYIIDKYLKGEATESERMAVDAWYRSFEDNPGLTDQLPPEEVARVMAKSFASLAGKLNSPVINLKSQLPNLP